MPVPSAISELSQTPGSCYPTGSESPITADNYLRTYASFIALLRDGKGFTNPVTLASAATCDIGGQNAMFVEITGTTGISSFGTNYYGPRYLRFQGALTLTYNATSLILPGSASITTAAGDTCIVVPNQALNGWTVVSYQAAASSPTAPSGITSINGGQLAGLRNKIINGGFKVDQRNSYASQTITAGAALAYTADRWYAYSTGANVTGQVVAGASQSQKRYQFTGAASVTAIGFGTRLEAKDTYDLNNKTVTISADLANSLLTTVTWTLYRATTTDDTFGTLASPTVTSIATGTFTVSSTVTRYSTQVSVPAAATTGLQLVFSVGAQTSGTWTIGDVQLELGSSATPFEVRPHGMELALCQRYYYRISPGAIAKHLGSSGYNLTTSTHRGLVQFPVTMRAEPTALEQSGTANQYMVNSNNGNTQCTSVPTFGIATTSNASFIFTTGATLTAGSAGFPFTDGTNGASAYLGWSAEL